MVGNEMCSELTRVLAAVEPPQRNSDEHAISPFDARPIEAIFSLYGVAHDE
jgi:hypothetical protein